MTKPRYRNHKQVVIVVFNGIRIDMDIDIGIRTNIDIVMNIDIDIDIAAKASGWFERELDV